MKVTMKIEIDIDVHTDIQEEGISREIFVAHDYESSSTTIDTWEQIIESNIGYHIIPYDGSICPEDLKELKNKVKGLKRAAELFEKRIKQFEKN